MNEKELTKNVEKIKQFLTLPDYDKIDAVVQSSIVKMCTLTRNSINKGGYH